MQTMTFWGKTKKRDEMILKCGLCKADVKEQPKITAEGNCSVCGAKLKPA
jgi:DNA-directed RNA polymerase subunit RPC12/RpoP